MGFNSGFKGLRMSVAIPLLPLYGRTASTRTTLSFLTFKQFVTLQCYVFLLVRSYFYSLISCLFLPLILVAYFLYFFIISYCLLFRLIHCILLQLFFLPYLSMFILPPILAKWFPTGLSMLPTCQILITPCTVAHSRYNNLDRRQRTEH